MSLHPHSSISPSISLANLPSSAQSTAETNQLVLTQANISLKLEEIG